VLCEKPLATSLPDALDLVKTARRVGRTMTVSQNYRFNSPFRAMQSAVSGGEIGDLVSVEIDFRRDTRELFAPNDFRYSMRHPLLLDMAIHHFDLLRAATGGNLRRVHARGWRAPDSPFAHHPEMVATLDLEGGVPVVYRATWTAREPETSWNGDWVIVGEEGRLLWTGDLEDRNVGEVTIERWDEPPRILEQPSLRFIERAATLQALRAATETGKDPETLASDNVNSLAVVLGCARSIDSGETVDVPGLMNAARNGKV
jgi:predicted dehydrogenase